MEKTQKISGFLKLACLLMHVLLHPSYFPNIASCVAMAKADALHFEFHDSYQKQTFRNRTYIYSANGKLSLNIPVKYTQRNRQFYREIQIANDGKWQVVHWKSLHSAYSTSPFFEFYQDELKPLFETEFEMLFDFNLKCLQWVAHALQWDLSYTFTKSFDKSPKAIDLRALINARKDKEKILKPYFQGFSNKHGFLSNLSILDLIFNEGPNAMNYLQSQDFNELLA